MRDERKYGEKFGDVIATEPDRAISVEKKPSQR